MARTVSITQIIKRYGLSSKRLYPKNRINYSKAIEMLKAFGNTDVTITDIIDNVWNPEKSISDHCQVEGCNHAIRWEYVLRNEVSGKTFVAGSTCVWPILGLSEIETKRFSKMQNVMQEFHEKLQWEKDNPDVVEKLEKAKQHGLFQFRPYWEEINFCKLGEEDTEYIRKVDMDAIIRRADEISRARREKEAAKIAGWNEVKDAVTKALEEMVRDNFGGYYAQTLYNTVRRGDMLSRSDVNWVKANYNSKWFRENIQGTQKDKTLTCIDYLDSFIKTNANSLDTTIIGDYIAGNVSLTYVVETMLAKIKDYIAQINDSEAKYSLIAYQCMKGIV